MKHGHYVSEFERAFADYVQAKHAVAMTNGTVTIQVALMALGLQRGQRVFTTPLTMSATTIAILNAGGVPVYRDVHPDTWLMDVGKGEWPLVPAPFAVPVSLYGLHMLCGGPKFVDDAAQTLRPHGNAAFTSYSLQRSKILNTGEGGVLVTNDEGLATEAREIASLGYKLGPSQSRIDSNAIKSPTYDRHHRAVSLNARMNDLTAAEGLRWLEVADSLIERRRYAADFYRDAITGCAWLTPQDVPEGWGMDYWSYAVATDTPARAIALADAVRRHGGEVPYFAWKVTHAEPAFRHLAPMGTCPIAEDLQPRILAFQTNNFTSAERNARALRRAIMDLA